MHKLLLMPPPRDHSVYLHLLQAAHLPNLELVDQVSAGVDLVFGDPARISTVLPELLSLKWVQATWAGVEPLLAPSLQRDYILTNARGVFGDLMAEYVFSHLLLRERRILPRLEAQKQARWEPALPGTLKGKTIGLLGVGSIGARLAETAKFFGMQVRGYTRASETSPHVDRYYHGDDLLAFAGGLDVLVSVLPGTTATRHLVDDSLFAALPPHCGLVSAGRGSVVDETALLDALEQERLGWAVLDVFEKEPLPPEHPLWHAKNLLITSHTAAPSFPQDLVALFIENYLLYINAQPLKYQVNFELGY
ncbi:MAG TPA: D-2-hydroxyacid dehydrogenase [Anaerolineales bacterium]|jgi:phosphoglycerate dehydrogenase-like enzyme